MDGFRIAAHRVAFGCLLVVPWVAALGRARFAVVPIFDIVATTVAIVPVVVPLPRGSFVASSAAASSATSASATSSPARAAPLLAPVLSLGDPVRGLAIAAASSVSSLSAASLLSPAPSSAVIELLWGGCCLVRHLYLAQLC